jgi:hypothetical protein
VGFELRALHLLERLVEWLYHLSHSTLPGTHRFLVLEFL